MSDTNTIKMNNGTCVTADLGFSSKTTIEEWILSYLRILMNDPRTSTYFEGVSPNDFEVNILPVRLMDTMALSTEILTDKRNFASSRAEEEARTYAAKFYDNDSKDDAEFFRSYMPQFISTVRQGFIAGEGKDGYVRILSERSYLRLTQAFVNILLCKKPDGTDNMHRRRKAKEDVFITNSDGTKSRVYYTDEEINEAEKKMYDDNEAHSFVSLDMEYSPFTIENTLLSASALMEVTRTNRSDAVEELSIEEIFTPDESDSEISIEQLDELLIIAKRDLAIIDLIQERSKSGDILAVVHADCTGTDVPVASTDKLTMRERYLSLMYFVRIITGLAVPLIQAIRINAPNASLTKGDVERIIGIDSSIEGNYIQVFNEMLEDEDLRTFVASLPVKYRISEYTFIILLVNIVRRATMNAGVSAKKIVDAFASHIGYSKPNGNHYIVRDFFKYLTASVPETAIEDVQGLINTCEGRREPMVSYAYRNVHRYMTESGVFGIELAVLDSCVNITEYRNSGSRKAAPVRYNMSNNNFTFSIDSVVATISKLMGMDNLTDGVNPFAAYKAEIVAKEETLAVRRKEISAEIEKIYGASFPKYYIEPPSIPYNNSERQWARNKCIKIEEEIKIITESNPSYDWDSFRRTLQTLTELTRTFANSDFEDPDVVESLRVNSEIFESMCKECNLTSDDLNKVKKLEKDLREYLRLDEFQGEFVPFKFDFKKDLGDTMNFHVSKTSILYNGNIRTVQSLLGNPDLQQILCDYFRPFFEPYATINTEDFDIKISTATRINTKSNNQDNNATITDIIMSVVFGSSDDVHVCSKFRSRFPCILDTRRMIREAKADAGRAENEEFNFADISDKFIIKWARTIGQNTILSGKSNESALAAIGSTRGAYEQYPAYDSMMGRIVLNAFKNANDRYVQSIALKRARENQMNKPKRVIGAIDDFGFAEMSAATKADITHNQELWANLTMSFKGQSTDSVGTLQNIVQSNMVKSQDARTTVPSKQPFGQKKSTTNNMGRSSYGEKKGALSTENTHGPTADTSESVIRAMTREQMYKKWVVDEDGFRSFTYEKKDITSYVKTGSTTPNEIKERRLQAGKTPDRHGSGVIPDNRERSRHGPGGSRQREMNSGRGGKRDGTPRRGTPNASKATPVSLGNSASPYMRGTASPYRGGSNNASPSQGKRGYAPGTASPSGFEYLQPDHDMVGSNAPVNVYGGGAASPGQNQPQLFHEIEAPLGIFYAEAGTPRDNGSRGSQSSRGNTSLPPNDTPKQDFNAPYDDFDI